MAKIIQRSEEKVSEVFKCPHCGTTFEAKAEDITEFDQNHTKYIFGVATYACGYIKCPYCTNKLEISHSDCSNPFLKRAFRLLPSKIYSCS